jgi:peptide/nickel transport system substrate-binding protein/oligopeptide transport system substrate-binding protein
MPGKIIQATIRGMALCMACCFFFGCGGEDRRLPDTLYVRLKRNPTTLDPALIVDLDGARIAAKLFSGLVRFDDSLAAAPDLAQSWTVSADSRTYTFKLKKGIDFFNGRELRAEDVAYSFERVLDPKTRSPRTWVLSRIKGAQKFMRGEAALLAGITVAGPHEISITIDEPFAPFINFLGLTTAYIVPREEVERRGADFGFYASGAGPFKLEAWQHNQFIHLAANSSYAGQQPRLAGICYKIIPEDFTALVEFEKGDLDLLPEIMASDYDRFVRDPKWRSSIDTAPGLNTYYLGLNCQMPPFTDARVRRALNHAIDREKMLATIMSRRGELAAGPLPPQLRGGAAPAGYSYDPARARQLLAAAGFPQGFAMTIYQTADLENLDICQVLQSYLRDVGIDARIVQLEWSTFIETVAKGDAQAFWLSWWADYPDAENFLYPMFHSANWGAGGNKSRFKNPDIDDRIVQALGIMDTRARQAAYRDIEKAIVQEAPWVFFWHKADCSLRQPWVTGYRAFPLAVMDRGDCLAVSRPPG